MRTCCSVKTTRVLGRDAESLKYSPIASGVVATDFIVVPQNTAPFPYIALIRAGSRLSNAARQASVAARISFFAVSEDSVLLTAAHPTTKNAATMPAILFI